MYFLLLLLYNPGSCERDFYVLNMKEILGITHGLLVTRVSADIKESYWLVFFSWHVFEVKEKKSWLSASHTRARRVPYLYLVFVVIAATIIHHP